MFSSPVQRPAIAHAGRHSAMVKDMICTRLFPGFFINVSTGEAKWVILTDSLMCSASLYMLQLEIILIAYILLSSFIVIIRIRLFIITYYYNQLSSEC